MKPREQVIAENPLRAYCEDLGCRFKQTANGEAMALCPLPAHNDKTPSFHIYDNETKWKCFGCNEGGNIADLISIMELRDPDEVWRELAKDADGGNGKSKPKLKAKAKPLSLDYRTSETYEYKDGFGKTLFCVDRQEAGDSKKFIQYHVVNGKRVNNLDGVTRVLYRLRDVMRAETVCLCEGEKCVHALESLGYVATTNPGGSSSWKAAYVEWLDGKDIIVLPDMDTSGQKKWLPVVQASLQGRARTVAVVNMPKPYNDIADLLEAEGDEDAHGHLVRLIDGVVKVAKGIDLPIYNSQELIDKYMHQIKTQPQLELRKWLPSLRKVRGLVPGDMVSVLAATGGGKTALLQNIALAFPGHTVLWFQIELSAPHLTERISATAERRPCHRVESRAKLGFGPDPAAWAHIWVCPESRLNVEKMIELVNSAELKIGRRPDIVMVDYIGLVQGGSGKRYERLSSIAEEFKVLAKSCNVVLFVASQVRRKHEDANDEVGIFDAKDSGSIENSSQLVLGAWRLPDGKTMRIRILKDTKGQGGWIIDCNFDGPTLTISEQAAEPEDWEP